MAGGLAGIGEWVEGVGDSRPAEKALRGLDVADEERLAGVYVQGCKGPQGRKETGPDNPIRIAGITQLFFLEKEVRRRSRKRTITEEDSEFSTGSATSSSMSWSSGEVERVD